MLIFLQMHGRKVNIPPLGSLGDCIMPLPHDVSPDPAAQAHLPGSAAPLPEAVFDAADSELDINARRARVENPEALRLARAL